jgi:riboflavin kinase / FMN adenylyltransferase
LQVIWDIHRIYPKTDSIVTVGTFDGIHRGHQRIVQRLVQNAQKDGWMSTVVTFEPHPQLVIKSSSRSLNGILTTIDEKIAIFSQLDVERLVVANFTALFADIQPDEFVSRYLLGSLQMKKIILGHDHTFGRDREGNSILLKRMADTWHFEVEELEPVNENEQKISSTHVRSLLNDGKVEAAAQLLARPYSLQGQVVPGHGRGRTLGFPTANLKSFSQYKLVPKQGIYATRCHVGDKVYDSVTYIGIRPTFDLDEKVIEIHIPEFEGELYGQKVEVDFLYFIRDDTKFSTEQELVQQILADKMKSLELLKNN